MYHERRMKKKKTSVKKNCLKPVYNEAIVFDVPHENIEEVSLIIKVVDYDRCALYAHSRRAYPVYDKSLCQQLSAFSSVKYT